MAVQSVLVHGATDGWDHGPERRDRHIERWTLSTVPLLDRADAYQDSVSSAVMCFSALSAADRQDWRWRVMGPRPFWTFSWPGGSTSVFSAHCFVVADSCSSQTSPGGRWRRRPLHPIAGTDAATADQAGPCRSYPRSFPSTISGQTSPLATTMVACLVHPWSL